VPDDVIEFSRQVHRAFPDVPLLGTDIIREHTSGKLYALEVNSFGWCFHLTTSLYDDLLQNNDIDLRKQFGGAAAVARGIHRRLSEGVR
jgi:D-alanine-D-alanine ligase-like ATP-grasp enzyme